MIIDKVNQPIKVGVLGFGGLGQAAARILAPKGEMTWVAAADRQGYAYNDSGLDPNVAIKTYHDRGSIGYLDTNGTLSENSISDLVTNHSVDGYFLALPNLTNTFMAYVAKQFIESGWQ